MNNPTYCGNAQLNIVTQDIKNLKPAILTPKDTICYYEVSMPSQMNITLNFTLNQYESLSIYFCNGTCTQIQYKSNGRMLGMVERGLSSSTKYSFSSNGYSKLSLLYTNSEVTVSSISCESPIGPSSNQSSEIFESTSKSSNGLLYFACIFPVFCFCCCCFVCLITLNFLKMRKDKQRLRRIIQNQELDRRVSHIELNRNRIYEEDKSQNSIHKINYTDKKYITQELSDCAFCLDPMNEKNSKNQNFAC